MVTVAFHVKRIEVFSTTDAWVGVVSSSSQAFKDDMGPAGLFLGFPMHRRGRRGVGNGDGPIRRRGRQAGKPACAGRKCTHLYAFVAGYGTSR